MRDRAPRARRSRAAPAPLPWPRREGYTMRHGRHEAGRARHAARARRADACSTRATRSRSACAPTRAPRRRSPRRRPISARSRRRSSSRSQGIGKSTAEKIRELLETGKVAKLEALRAEAPARAWSRCCASRASGRRRSRSCAPSSACESIDDLRSALAEHKLRELEGLRREVGGEARAGAGAARRAGRGRPHADLGGAAARDAHRRAPARGAGRRRTRRTAARCAASRRRSATSTSWWPRATRRR